MIISFNLVLITLLLVPTKPPFYSSLMTFSKTYNVYCNLINNHANPKSPNTEKRTYNTGKICMIFEDFTKN